MEGLLRLTDSLDWITLILLGFLLAFSIARQFTALSLTEFLSAYSSSRFIKITSDGRVDNYRGYQSIGIILYAVCIALLGYKLISLYREVDFKDLLLLVTVISAFLLFKHYLSRLVCTLGNFEELIERIDHQRNIYRGILSFTALIAVVLVFYILPRNHLAIWWIVGAASFIILAYHLLLVYSHRKALITMPLYFILYLCTLEIAPYLLLYKYITA